MNIMSSPDLGVTWKAEHAIAHGSDVREPTLVSFGGRLFFHYFQSGSNPLSFEPVQFWRAIRHPDGRWSASEKVDVDAHEVPWDIKARGGRLWMTSYNGQRYTTGDSAVRVLFRTSSDGIRWISPAPQGPTIYFGGLSEVAFEFDETGGLWGVARNEDGDATGWGSHVVTASAQNLSQWTFPRESDPQRYDSPRMLRHGKDLYLLARRDLPGPYDMNLDFLPIDFQRYIQQGLYWLRPKRTALYRIDPQQRKVVWIQDLPSCGDTAFPSIVRLSAHEFLIANYTSPLDDLDLPWVAGQINVNGTKIYLIRLRFVPK